MLPLFFVFTSCLLLSSALPVQQRQDDLGNLRVHPSSAASGFNKHSGKVPYFDPDKLRPDPSLNAAKNEMIDSKTFTKRLGLSVFHPCDSYDEQKKECVYVRALGTTLTVGVHVDAPRDEPSSVHWFRFFKMNDERKTIYKQALRRDALPWNINIGGDYTELRISPISESDFSFNFFLASIGDPSMKDQQYIKFVIEPLPIDMGPVYQGEEIAISLRSFIELPKKSLNFEWSAVHFRDSSSVPSHLPSNMRLTRDRSAVIIKEHRSFVDMTITCAVYSSKGFCVARRSFYLRKTASPTTPDAQFRGNFQPLRRTKRSVNTRDSGRHPDIKTVFVPHMRPHLQPSEHDKMNQGSGGFQSDPETGDVRVPGKDVMTLSFFPEQPEHTKIHDALNSQHQRLPPAKHIANRTLAGRKGFKTFGRTLRGPKNKMSSAVRAGEKIGQNAAFNQGRKEVPQNEDIDSGKGSLSKLPVSHHLDHSDKDLETPDLLDNQLPLNRKKRSSREQEDNSLNFSINDETSSQPPSPSDLLNPPLFQTDPLSQRLQQLLSESSYQSFAATDLTDFGGQLNMMDSIHKRSAKSASLNFSQQYNHLYLAVYSGFHQQLNIIKYGSKLQSSNQQEQTVGEPAYFSSIVVNEESLESGYVSEAKLPEFDSQSGKSHELYISNPLRLEDKSYLEDLFSKKPFETSVFHESRRHSLTKEENGKPEIIGREIIGQRELSNPLQTDGNLQHHAFSSNPAPHHANIEAGRSRISRKKRSIEEFYSYPSLRHRFNSLRRRQSVQVQENGSRTKRSQTTEQPSRNWEDPRSQDFRDVQEDYQKPDDGSYDYPIVQSGNVFSEVEVTETSEPIPRAFFEDDQRPLKFYSVRELPPANRSSLHAYKPRTIQASKLGSLIEEANTLAEDVKDGKKLKKKIQVVASDRMTFEDRESLLMHSCVDDADCGVNADCFQIASGDTFCRCRHRYRGNGLFCWLL